MRSLFAGVLALSLLSAAACGPRRAATVARPATAPAAVPTAAPRPAATPAADVFQSSVRPLLGRTCAPCHNPGGRMYDRLPFDDPAVVATHREAILRRLKGDDRAVLEAWRP